MFEVENRKLVNKVLKPHKEDLCGK